MYNDKSKVWNEYVNFTMALSVTRLKNSISASLLHQSETNFEELPNVIIAEFEDKLNKYLDSFDNNKKHILLKRLQDDIRQFSGLFNAKNVIDRIKELMTIDDSLNNDITDCIDFMRVIIHDDIIQHKLIEVETNLLEVKPKRTKPTKETELALSQNEVMYLFKLLGNREVFSKGGNSSHLARGLNALNGYSIKKARDKGKTLSVAELQNIKDIIDNISTSLDKDISNGGIK